MIAERNSHHWLLRRSLTALLLVGCWVTPAAGADAPAGSTITNVASLHYDLDGVQQSVASNPAMLAVAERLDLTLARVGSGPVALETGVTAMPFVLTNTGNGNEVFALEPTLDAGESRVRFIAVDSSGDGRFDPGNDTPLTDGRTPVLSAGSALRLLVIVDTSGPPSGGSLTLHARALTGSGQPGGVFAGQGDGGSDAVVGPTGAAASVPVPLAIGASAPTLVKSQVVTAPDGSSLAVRGAVIAYTLAAQFPAATAAATITDPIPAGTTYVAGSLTLDGQALTEAADADPGRVDGTGVTVALGDLPAAATRTVRFTVTIQ